METSQHRPTGPQESRSRVDRTIGYATTLSTVVLTALFVQKSDGNTALETVLLLGTAVAGMFLIAGAVAGFFYRAAPRPHKLGWYLARRMLSTVYGIVGVAAVIVSMILIDSEPTDSKNPPVVHEETGRAGSDIENVVDGKTIQLRNLVIAESSEAARFTVTVINVSEAPLLLSRATIYRFDEQYHCSSEGERYSLNGHIRVYPDGKATASLEVESGQLEGFTIEATGVYGDSCTNDAGFYLRFPITISLKPLDTTSLTVDIRRDLQIISAEREGQPLNKKSIMPFSTFATDGYATGIGVIYDGESVHERATICRQTLTQRPSSSGRNEPGQTSQSEAPCTRLPG